MTTQEAIDIMKKEIGDDGIVALVEIYQSNRLLKSLVNDKINERKKQKDKQGQTSKWG